MDVNLFGVVSVTKSVLSLLRASKHGGRVVNVSSICGINSLAGSSSYCCSKYGVEAFSDVLRREMDSFGVSVHIVEPGFFKTPLIVGDNLRKDIVRNWNTMPPTVKEAYGEEFYHSYSNLVPKATERFANEDPQDVVDAMLHALTSPFPKIRYPVGGDATVLWVPMSVLPGWCQDWLFFLLAQLGEKTPLPSAARPQPRSRFRLLFFVWAVLSILVLVPARLLVKSSPAAVPRVAGPVAIYVAVALWVSSKVQ